MKVAKYILSVFLIIASLGVIKNGNITAGLSTLTLGVILLPPISEKIKEQIILFQNKIIRYGIYIALFLIAGVLLPKSETDSFVSNSKTEVFESKESVLIKYIKNNKNDKSLQNIKWLAGIGGLFSNNNHSIVYPQQGYITEQYDSIKEVAVLTFNPKFDYNGSDDISFLKDDAKNGKLKGYSVQYEVDKNDNVTLKKTTITYAKIIKDFMTISDVPNVESFVDEVVINKRKQQIVEKEKIANERRKVDEVMGDNNFWSKYDPLVKNRIYKLIVEKDCRELQNEYNTAADMMERKQNNGIRATKEVELVSFLDDKMRDLDCY